MDAKLNHSDLSALLAKECNLSVAKSEQFTKAIFDLIIEGLEQDGTVKINGLGTFKVTDVASRSSVNVNTGEKFEIKGHKKLTFTPAETLKEEINKPFAMFEPVEVDDSYQDEESYGKENEDEVSDMPATGIVAAEVEKADDAVEEIVPDIPVEEEMPANEIKEEERKPALQIEEEMPAEEEQTQQTEMKETVKREAKLLPEATISSRKEETANSEETVAGECEETSPQPVCQSKSGSSAEIPEKKTEERPEKTGRKRKAGNRKWLAVAALLAVIIIIIGNRYLSTDTVQSETMPMTIPVTGTIGNEKEEYTSTPQTGGQQIAAADDMEERCVTVDRAGAEETYKFELVEELAARSLKSISVADTLLYNSTGDIAIHIVAEDETLVKIAYKHYGDKRLWPYIVKHNNLAKPNDLCKGMELSIPELTPRK